MEKQSLMHLKGPKCKKRWDNRWIRSKPMEGPGFTIKNIVPSMPHSVSVGKLDVKTWEGWWARHQNRELFIQFDCLMAQGESGILKKKKKIDHYLAQDTSTHSKWQEEMANINPYCWQGFPRWCKIRGLGVGRNITEQNLGGKFLWNITKLGY